MRENRQKLNNLDIRIENLRLKKACYIGEEPEMPSIHIDKIEPNSYYGHEDDYEWSEDGESAFWKNNETGETHYNMRINKSCFENPESCFAIASFDYDEHEDFYELHFVGDRPLDLDENEREVFWNIIKIGNEILNNCSHTSY